MTNRNLPSKTPVTKTCTVWLVSRNKPESSTQDTNICLIHWENCSSITGNKQNNWLRMAETPQIPTAATSRPWPVDVKWDLWNINCSCWSSSKWRGAKESQLMLEVGRDGAGNPIPGAPAVPTKGAQSMQVMLTINNSRIYHQKEKWVALGFWKSSFTQVEAVIIE